MTKDPPASAPRRLPIWCWFVLAFAIQAAAWVVWFMIAAQNRVAEVPLAPAG